MNQWNPDYLDMLSALSAEGVEYLIVGAYALAAHQVPRATGDVDIWIRPTDANAERAIRALVRFGAPLATLSKQDLCTPEVVYQIGIAPNRIDLLTSLSGLTFEEAWSHRIRIEVRGQAVPVLGREDLIRNKLATGRKRDLADVAALLGEE